jgi:hypothetical protein
LFALSGAPRLVDVDAADDRTSIMASNVTMRREAMYGLTNLLWQLSDLIQYISNVVNHRGGPDDNINDINDIRNGLLLSDLLHGPFGAGHMAFLEVRYYSHPRLS